MNNYNISNITLRFTLVVAVMVVALPLFAFAGPGIAPVQHRSKDAGRTNTATFAFSAKQRTAPGVTSANKATFTAGAGGTFTVGAAGTFTVTTTGTPTPSLSETGGLPSGVTFKDNGNGSGTLSGTPASGTSGTYSLTFTASNGVGTPASQTFTLTVGSAASLGFVQVNYAVPQAPQTLVTVTYTQAQTAGNLNVVVVGWNDSTAQINSVMDSRGNAYALAVGPTVQSGTATQAIYYAKNIGAAAANSNTVTVTFNTGAAYPDVRIAEYSGIDPTTPVDAVAAAQGSGASSNSGLVTTGNANDLLVGANLVQSTSTTAGAGYTSRVITPDGDILEDRIVSATGSYSATAVLDKVQPWIMQMVAFRAAGSGVGTSPSITSANNTTFTVGAAGTFTVTTTGTPTPSLSETGGLPSGVTFKDNGNGSGTLSGTPASGTSGTYSLTFTASNGVGTPAKQTFTLTVNLAPVITSANNTTFTVGAAGTFTVTTTGTPTPSLSETGGLPSGVTFKDNGNGSATLSGTPASGTSGTYSLTFTASNGVGTPAKQTFTLTVNLAPVITSANNTTFTVGAAGTFTVTTTGTPTPSLSETGGLPSGVTFKDNGNGSATLSGTPASGTSGTYSITFTASNGVGTAASQTFTLTVTTAQTAPVITSANNTTFTVGAAGTFTVTTTGTPTPSLSETGGLPSGVTFKDNGNGSATLSGTPASGTSGTYSITFTASNGVGTAASQTFTLTVGSAASLGFVQVNYAVPQAPQTLVTVTYTQAQTAGNLNVVVVGWNDSTAQINSVTDSRGNAYVLAVGPTVQSGTATQAIYYAKNIGAAAANSNTVTVTFNTGAAYPDVRIAEYSGIDPTTPVDAVAAAQGSGASSNSGLVTTGNANDLLVGANLVQSTSTTAGAGYTSRVITPDGDILEDRIVSATGSYSATAVLDKVQPWIMQMVAFRAAGSGVGTSPSITSANNTTFTVGAAGTFTVTTTGTPTPSLSETGGLPSGVTFKDNGNGSGTLSGTPASGTSGTYSLTFTASNGVGTPAKQTFTLTVNLAPVITSANNTTFTVGAAGTFTVTTTGTPTPSLSETGGLPSGVTFKDNGNGSGTLSGTPASGTSGTYSITFTASNGVGTAASQTFTLTVTTAQTAPVITSANNTTFTVGAAGTFTVTTTGTPTPSLSETGGLPSGVTFKDNGNGSATLSGTPASGTSGTYSITFTASNGVGTAASQTFTLTVGSAASLGFVQVNYAVPQAPQTLVTVTYTQAQTAGNLNVVVVGWNDSTAQINSVMDSRGNAYALAVGPTVQSGTATQAIYYAKNIGAAAANSNTVTVTFNTGAAYPDVRIAEYSGIDPTTPVDVVAAAQGSGASSNSGLVTTGNANDLLVGANLVQSTSTTAGAGYTSRVITPDGDILEDRIVSATGSYSATAVLDKVQPWIMQMVAFRVAGSGGGTSPNITSLSPTSGPVGTPVTIIGTNFGAMQGTSTVKFNGTTATIGSWNAASIATSVPTGASTGNVVVTVNGVASNGVNFTVSPSIIGLSPTSGPVGTAVTITGTNFGATQGTSTVKFNGTTATIGSWSAASIATSVPTGATTGNVVVTVNGVASNGVSFTVTSIFVTLSPKRAAVTMSQSQQFTATVNNDPQNGGVSWSVDGISGGNTTSGTISSAGLFTPGTQPGMHTVTATSNSNTSASASAMIAVTDVTGVFTYHNDAARTGQNVQEYALTTATVNSSTFGALFSCPVDGYIFAAPLYVANFNIGGQTRNVVVIATEHDSVYAFDADSSSCVQLWHISFLSSGVTTVPPADTGETEDLIPEIGITSTPVIDPSTNTIYVVPKTKETVGSGCSSGSPCYFHRLHALDLATGAEKFGGPVVLSAPNFVPLHHLQRPALLLGNGAIYIAFGSHGDNNVWQGWLMAYNATTLAPQWVWHSTDPTSGNNEGAIWGSGNGPALDASGNIYVETGNGVFDGINNFSDSVIKLSPAGTRLDFFTPFDQAVMQQNNIDLGSSGPIILPDAVGSLANPHLMIITGKVGVVYLLDQTNLGAYHTAGNQDVGEVSVGFNTTNLVGGFFGQPAYWNGNIYTVIVGDSLRQYSISNAVISTVFISNSSNTFQFRAATPAVSASGTNNGIVWVADITAYQTSGPVILDAYDATNVSALLFSSPSSGSGAAAVATKFTVPTVANGKVYVGGQLAFTVFGLLPN